LIGRTNSKEWRVNKEIYFIIIILNKPLRLMVEHIKGKRVPWSQMEEYNETHKKTITKFIDLWKSEVMEIPDIETKLPNSFAQLHKVISKILKDNNILHNEEESKVDQL
jgi:hypothetical protein